MRDIKTIDDLIAEFGGPARFGEWLDIGQEAVSAFKWHGVSPGWHLRLRAELRRRGCDVHPGVFGLTEDERVGAFDAPKAPAPPRSAAFAEAEAEAKRFNAAMKASEAQWCEAKQAVEKAKVEALAARADVCVTEKEPRNVADVHDVNVSFGRQ